MEVNSRITHYVVRFHGHLMTEVERKAQRHLFATMKAMKGASDERAQCEAKKHKIHSRMLCDEPDVLRLARDGYEAFELRVAARILGDSTDKVFFQPLPHLRRIGANPHREAMPFLRA